MKPRIITLVFVTLALSHACVLAQQSMPQPEAPKEVKIVHAPAPSSPEWQQLKTLVGLWQGAVSEDGKQMGSTLEIRMTGGGSAIMHLLDKDTSHEMVTMFHPDGPTLLATHYCAAHNQPRMQLVTAPGPNQIAFRFKDGTNIGPGDGHMTGLVITFIDADHHDETWTYEDHSQELPPTVFHYTRKR
jgi:hypothetical protein